MRKLKIGLINGLLIFLYFSIKDSYFSLDCQNNDNFIGNLQPVNLNVFIQILQHQVNLNIYFLISISMKQAQDYRLCLIEGDYFSKQSQQQDWFYLALFQHFSLLSWIPQQSKMQIINKQFYDNPSEIIIYEFRFSNHPQSHFLLQFNKNHVQKSIDYCIFDKRQDFEDKISNLQFQAQIKVIFSIHIEVSKLQKQTSRQVIFIDIKDIDGFFRSNNIAKSSHQLNKSKKYFKKNEIEYFYKEALSQRNKEYPHCHFNLAFQGGGAKGVSYVGVYKALKQLHKNTPISSVIGSSAGGILALAISTEMLPDDISQLCLKMDSIPRDKYYKSQDEITGKDQQVFDSIIYKIKCLLHNYGLVQSTLFDQFLQSISDIETNEKILQVLECINPSIAELFSLNLKTESKDRSRLNQVKYTRRFNYYGLLMAGMMKGEAVQNIAAQCLVNFMSKHFDIVTMKKNPQWQSRLPTINKILKKWGYTQEQIKLKHIFQNELFHENVKRLTLKEYYLINKVEFTCTSVDLNDQILRFFNHLTTPNLPVCKTVQMTGSFPVAFQAQKWRKQWGKYYIHYPYSKRQIDLTGHEFTDGGLLANFPIKYLDNELMRPMYFTHKKTQKTILYGFGLDPVKDPEDNTEQKQKLKEQAITNLKDHLMAKFSKLRLLKNLIMSNSAVQLENVQLQEVPVLNYLLKLYKTLTIADYNLNKECFRKIIIQTEVEEKVIEKTKNIKEYTKKYDSFDKHLQILSAMSQSKKSVNPVQLLTSTCEKLKLKLNEYETLQNNVIEQVKYRIIQSLNSYQGIRLKNNISQSVPMTQIIKQLKGIFPPQLFHRQSNMNIKFTLIGLIDKISAYFRGMPLEQQKNLSIIFNKILYNQLITIKRIRERVKIIQQNLNKAGKEIISNQQFTAVTFIDFQLVLDLILMEKRFLIADQEYINDVMKEIKQLQLPVIGVEMEIIDKTIHYEFHINNILNNSQNNKIHLVLESKENSNLYYCGIYTILQEVLGKEQHRSKNIEMITTSDFHSIFAFLLASGKKINNIKKEMWIVKDLIQLEENIEQEFQQYRWAKTYSQEMNQLMDLTWKDQYQIFGELERYLENSDTENLKSQIKLMKTEFTYSKHRVSKAMENVLDYIVSSAQEVIKIKDADLRKKKLAQLLSLKNGKYGKDYNQKNKMISTNTQRLINKMMLHFEEITTCLLLNNYLVKETNQKFKMIDKQIIWKGIIIKRLLSSKKLEIYIKEKLQDMKLNTHTTLSQYYQFCPRKITLNFTLVNKEEERLQIINRFTKPNMPIWAAILASTSMPLVFSEFVCQNQWDISPYSDSRMRKLINYFFNPTNTKKTKHATYISGNYASSLPLQFLTNEKIGEENYTTPKIQQDKLTKYHQMNESTADDFRKKSIKKSTQFTYIAFTFKKLSRKTKDYQYNPKDKRFFSFSNVLSLGMDYLLGRFKNIEVGFRDILKRSQILKLLSTRIECHDNTIMHYYNDETIKLPIRLGTLDFYKIEKGRSSILKGCIYQAQFVVRGIFQNLKINEGATVFEYISNRETYLQYQTQGDNVLIKFPSRSKWNQKLPTMYRIFYKKHQSDPYIQFEDEPIVVQKGFHFLYLKFCFPNMDKVLVQAKEFELDFRKMEDSQFEQNIVFKFNFNMIGRKEVDGSSLDQGHLKTRFIPESKPYFSESNIEQSCCDIIKPKERRKKDTIQVNQQAKSRLIMRTLVNFKNDGLYCSSCTSRLIRSQEDYCCSKCQNSANITGFLCASKNCRQKQQNKFCFQCVFMYLVSKKKGKYRCTPFDHLFEYYNNSESFLLCHFCGQASNHYYFDRLCNITMCTKCSAILDSKTML